MTKKSVTSLADLLTFLEKAAERYAPEWSIPIGDFEKAVREAGRRFEGRLTGLASDALQKLRNPFFRTTSSSAAIQNAQRARQANLKKFAKLLPGVIEAYGLAFQAELEIEVLENAKKLGQPTSRKKGSQLDATDANIQHFFDWMARYKIRPYIFGRLSEDKLELIARLIIDARNDPTYQRADNAWPLLFQAGLLDAPGAAPSADDQKLLGEAYHRLHKPDQAQLLPALERRLGRPLNVSPYLAAAVEAILSRADDVGEQEANILFAGAQEQIEDDVEVVFGLLNGTMDRIRIAAALQSIRTAANLIEQRAQSGPDVALATMVEAIDECDARGFPAADWPELVWKDLVAMRSTVSQHVTSRKQFWTLFAAALQRSELAGRHHRTPLQTLPAVVEEAEWTPVHAESGGGPTPAVVEAVPSDEPSQANHASNSGASFVPNDIPPNSGPHPALSQEDLL